MSLLTHPGIGESALPHLLSRIAAGQNCGSKHPSIRFLRLTCQLLESLDQRRARYPKAQVIRPYMDNQIRRAWVRKGIPAQALASGFPEQEKRHHCSPSLVAL